tara:strand:+ start:4645 stop:4914 length:270 start_codon:yes stop_codon:yes gene_type:complete
MKLVTSILRLLESYLSLKNKLHYSKLYENHRKYEEFYIKEIEKNRANSTNESADRADLLRERYIQECREFEHLSALYSKSQGGDSHSDH